MPSVFSTSSFDGKLSVHSLPDPKSSAKNAGAPVWLRRPAGVAWGFGGKFARFDSSSRSIKLRNIVTEADGLARSVDLQNAVDSRNIGAYCDSKWCCTVG